MDTKRDKVKLHIESAKELVPENGNDAMKNIKQHTKIKTYPKRKNTKREPQKLTEAMNGNKKSKSLNIKAEKQKGKIHF